MLKKHCKAGMPEKKTKLFDYIFLFRLLKLEEVVTNISVLVFACQVDQVIQALLSLTSKNKCTLKYNDCVIDVFI